MRADKCFILGACLHAISKQDHLKSAGAHSPDEQVHIPSVEMFWKLTLRVMDKLAAA